MNSDVVPPLVAGVVAIALTIQQYLTVLLLELSVDISAQFMTRYTLLGQFAAFVLVYGLLFGVSYWTGSNRSSGDVTSVAAIAFAVAAVCALVAMVAVLQFSGTGSRSLAFTASMVVSRSVATGIEMAVVVFAGIALSQGLGTPAKSAESGS